MKNIFILVILFLCGCFFWGCVSSTPKPEPENASQVQEKTNTNDEIIQTQQDIVDLRQKILDDTQIKMDNAQATLKDLIEARANLADAKIKLAEFQDRGDLVVQELQNLVQFYVNTRGKFMEQLESGTGKAKELYEIEIALMETNIRLTQAVTKYFPSGVQGIRAQ